jgi:hypothetical protein
VGEICNRCCGKPFFVDPIGAQKYGVYFDGFDAEMNASLSNALRSQAAVNPTFLSSTGSNVRVVTR